MISKSVKSNMNICLDPLHVCIYFSDFKYFKNWIIYTRKRKKVQYLTSSVRVQWEKYAHVGDLPPMSQHLHCGFIILQWLQQTFLIKCLNQNDKI